VLAHDAVELWRVQQRRLQVKRSRHIDDDHVVGLAGLSQKAPSVRDTYGHVPRLEPVDMSKVAKPSLGHGRIQLDHGHLIAQPMHVAGLLEAAGTDLQRRAAQRL